MRPDTEQRLQTLDHISKPIALRALERGENPDLALNPHKLRGRKRLRITSIHELGHAIVSRANGWIPTVISVIREENTLGFVKSVPSRMGSYFSRARESLAIKFGGIAAEKKLGHNDHRGAGSDMGNAENIALSLAYNFGGTANQYLSEAEQNAASTLNRYGLVYLHEQAEHLEQQGQIAA